MTLTQRNTVCSHDPDNALNTSKEASSALKKSETTLQSLILTYLQIADVSACIFNTKFPLNKTMLKF